MSNKSLQQYIQQFSRKYSQQINLNKDFEDLQNQFDFTIKSVAEILPPSVWIGIDQEISQNLKNDIERSRKTKEGFLKCYSKTSLLNKIVYGIFQEGIGSIQQSQQCLCIGFAVIKDQYNDFLKNLKGQLISCLRKGSCLIDLSEEARNSQLDKISKLIHKNYRVYLILDVKTNPQKAIMHQVCFYPHVQFSLKQLKVKGIKIATNDLFKKMETQQLPEQYGFLSLDVKGRLVFIDKNEPNLSETGLIGMWIYGSFAPTRTKRQFGRDECFWGVMMEFYTNSQVKKLVSVVGKNNGMLCYIDKNSRKINPIIYKFDIKKTDRQKWTLSTKSQIIEKDQKLKEIKIDTSSLTIIQEKEYSQISENFSKQEVHKNENINRQNHQPLMDEFSRSQLGSEISKNQKNYDEKDIQIKFLKKELEFYKKRCEQLEGMLNPLYMQSMMMNNPMLYQQQMNPYFQQQQPPMYPYPYPPQQPQSPQNLVNSRLSNPQQYNRSNQVSPKNKKVQERQVEIKSVQYCFPQEPTQQLTFSERKQNQKLFLKKHSSQENQHQGRKQSEVLKANSETIKDIFSNQDYRNISFQDSFVHEEERDKEIQDSSLSVKRMKSSEDKLFSERSPEFKRIGSLDQKYEITKKVEEERANILKQQENKQESLPKNFLKFNQKSDSSSQGKIEEEMQKYKKTVKYGDENSSSSDEEDAQFASIHNIYRKK